MVSIDGVNVKNLSVGHTLYIKSLDAPILGASSQVLSVDFLVNCHSGGNNSNLDF